MVEQLLMCLLHQTFVRDTQLSEDIVNTGNDTFIDVECCRSLVVIFPNKAGGTTVGLDEVAYVLDMAPDIFHRWLRTNDE